MEHPSKILKRLGLRPKKSLGQNFLSDGNVARKIADAVCRGEDRIIEVGPGLGALTLLLQERAEKILAVEVDEGLARFLREVVDPEKVIVVTGDILRIPEEELFRPFSHGAPLTLAGNLPYGITGPLLFRILSLRRRVRECVVMVQKEVGERLTSPPGTKEYGILTVLFGAFGEVRPLFPVKRTCFFPSPDVDSLVVRISFREEKESLVSDPDLLTSLVEKAFSQRRKTLRNALQGLPGGRGGVEGFLRRAGIDPGQRAEEVPPEKFVLLSRILEENGVDKAGG